MKIGIFEIERDWEKEVYLKTLKQNLGESLSNLDLIFTSEPLDSFTGDAYSDLNVAVIYIRSLVDEKVLDRLPNLKLLITRTTGTDHIDILSCQKRGIIVANSPYFAFTTVAEHTIGLIFALAKRFPTAISKIKNLDFSREGLLGFDLFGKTIGIIGTGNIGKEVARIAYGIGMKILAHDIKPDLQLKEKFGVSYVSLEELLKHSDIIVVMVPYYSKTHHMINLENIKLVKDEAMLINTARGPIVDTEALIWALQNRKLQGGIALDVFEGERVLLEMEKILENRFSPQEYEKALKTLHLLSYPNVIFTPHTAHYTKDALRRNINWVVETITQFVKTKHLLTTYSFYF
ncbi:MAG: D-lactate dehydrogenase [Thermodesulfobacterium sp. 37_54]|jgi:D-lactate dehydrogenase|nr:MAG: D-lactate dehydrogenase [Thermodesulfobacterium sp. 37_54]MDK2862105.1 D-lactate dehydrogenase [Thermodesulfobacterium sp.]HBT04432.1 hydroxyacid dehydrogenase [Thermodesulfobacterium commune]HCE80233.1 hydroxyacid dehydrogenase [Thermodesulfobacterium commune]HCP10675.1 hydroxyacid dehydrogenase [Thermodesulfobacterium commune]